ncbi:MAG: ion transporter [Paludibacteraceae bacterium]|nr:ion transporter [Paludibacteraceae bacterium]
METLKKIFLNKKIILSVILLNALIIFLQEWDYKWNILNIMEFACSVFFLIEMVVKIHTMGNKKYWQSGWNKLDGMLVIISIPSIVEYFFPLDMINLSILLVLRVLRILRIFKTMHFFPSFSKVVEGFKLAINRSYAVLLSFFVIVVIFSLINCSLFGDIAPEYFGNPLTSVYSVFRLCTVEGWYDIPDRIAEASSPLMGTLATGYFCMLLIMGGIIGMSFINSVFVDAMVSDNNDEVKEQLDRMEKQIEDLKKLLEEKHKN